MTSRAVSATPYQDGLPPLAVLRGIDGVGRRAQDAAHALAGRRRHGVVQQRLLQPRGQAERRLPADRGLHLSNFRLNVSTFCRIGGASFVR